MIHTANTSRMTRHVGVFNDKKIALILQLPEEPAHVHVVDTEALPDLYSQNLIDIINSPEAQNEIWLGNVLYRKMFYDGTNALDTLYNKGYVSVVPVGQVVLTPYPNHKVPLTDVIASMGATQPQTQTQTSQPNQDLSPDLNQIVAQEQTKLNQTMQNPTVAHNQHLSNLAGDDVESMRRIGENLLHEAELLEADAKTKRAQAAQYMGGTVAVKETSVSNDRPFVDPVTGRTYKTEGALKTAITKREKAANS